jgi:hypothetical protein
VKTRFAENWDGQVHLWGQWNETLNRPQDGLAKPNGVTPPAFPSPAISAGLDPVREYNF